MSAPEAKKAKLDQDDLVGMDQNKPKMIHDLGFRTSAFRTRVLKSYSVHICHLSIFLGRNLLNVPFCTDSKIKRFYKKL